MDGGSAEDRIAQRAEADDGDSAVGGKSIENIGPDRGRHARPLLVNGGLVDQHYGDLVADRIEAMARDAPQAAAVGLEFHLRATGRADENFEEVGTDCHLDLSV